MHDVAELVHKELASGLRYARLWRDGIEGRQIGPDYTVEDGDILELHEQNPPSGLRAHEQPEMSLDSQASIALAATPGPPETAPPTAHRRVQTMRTSARSTTSRACSTIAGSGHHRSSPRSEQTARAAL